MGQKKRGAVSAYMTCHASMGRENGAKGLYRILTNKNAHIVMVLLCWCACSMVIRALPVTIQSMNW